MSPLCRCNVAPHYTCNFRALSEDPIVATRNSSPARRGVSLTYNRDRGLWLIMKINGPLMLAEVVHSAHPFYLPGLLSPIVQKYGIEVLDWAPSMPNAKWRLIVPVCLREF